MLIKISNANRHYLAKGYSEFKSGDYQVVLRDTVFKLMKGFGTLERSADYKKYRQLYDDLFCSNGSTRRIEAMLPNEVESIVVDLLKTIDEVNAEYDKNAAAHGSFTLDGIILPILSNNSIHIRNPDTKINCRVFADRLNIKIRSFIKEHQGQKVKVTGFMSPCEDGTYYGVMPVAATIELLK